MAKTFRYRINNTEMLFDDIIYTDPEIGDDSTGNGTKEKPYKTIQKATNMVIKSNTAIILAEGTYEQPVWEGGYTNYGGQRCVFATKTYSIYFIGQGLKTIVNTAFNTNYSSAVSAGGSNLYMYNITVQIDCQYSGSSYSNCFIAGNYTYNNSAYMYNCIFRFVNTFTGSRGLYFSSRYSTNYAYNCIFDFGSNNKAYSGQNAWSTSYYLNMYNCVFKNIADWRSITASSDTPYLGMYNCMRCNDNYYNNWSTMPDGGGNIIYDPIFDNYMNIINTDLWKNSGYTSIFNSDNSRSHMGIYGGPYQWKQYTITPSQISINKYAAKVNKNEDYNFTFNINAPFVSSTVTNNQVPNGVYGSDNIIYKYPMDKTIWTNISGIEII